MRHSEHILLSHSILISSFASVCSNRSCAMTYTITVAKLNRVHTHKCYMLQMYLCNFSDREIRDLQIEGKARGKVYCGAIFANFVSEKIRATKFTSQRKLRSVKMENCVSCCHPCHFCITKNKRKQLSKFSFCGEVVRSRVHNMTLPWDTYTE